MIGLEGTGLEGDDEPAVKRRKMEKQVHVVIYIMDDLCVRSMHQKCNRN